MIENIHEVEDEPPPWTKWDTALVLVVLAVLCLLWGLA